MTFTNVNHSYNEKSLAQSSPDIDIVPKIGSILQKTQIIIEPLPSGTVPRVSAIQALRVAKMPAEKHLKKQPDRITVKLFYDPNLKRKVWTITYWGGNPSVVMSPPDGFGDIKTDRDSAFLTDLENGVGYFLVLKVYADKIPIKLVGGSGIGK